MPRPTEKQRGPLAPYSTGLSSEDTKAGRYQRALLRLYRQHQQQEDGLPTNGRFLFYEGLQAGDWPKHYPGARQPHQDVSDALLRLRELGLVDWDDIRDETRTLYEWPYASTINECLMDTVPYARINVWGSELPPLVLCESRSLGGVLRALLSRYLTPVAPTNGQTEGFLHADIAPVLHGNDRRVFYLGDYDWQGGQIENHTRESIEEIIGRRFTDETWRRIALTEQQVEENDLPIIQKTDHRYRPHRVHDAVETESLKQHILVGIVRDALHALLPEPLEDVLVREERQRKQMLRLLRKRR